MIKFPEINSCTIAVIGLGYVGLPLAVEFASEQTEAIRREVIGFDVNEERLNQLRNNNDLNKEISSEQLKCIKNIVYTSDINLLEKADVFIVTVPTPIDEYKKPNLQPLINASKTVAEILRNKKTNLSDSVNPIVIYESTVYPGATEEVCIPLIEKISKLVLNKDFYCGYSPERINPGDKIHKFSDVVKLTSGSNNDSADWIDSLYSLVIKAGTYKTSCIKIAEAAKVIENTQRDLNIALVNELAIIFNLLNIDTLEVLQAASTKWNFLPFQPGLVGGHCIGVDPYYLTYKSEQMGYSPQIVLAGRRINDSMSSWLVDRLVLKMVQKGLNISKSNVLILGLTFKENCPDIRNTKVIDMLKSIQNYHMNTYVVDPWVEEKKAKQEYEVSVLKTIPNEINFQAVILAVAHAEFETMTEREWNAIGDKDTVYFDLKGIIPLNLSPVRV